MISNYLIDSSLPQRVTHIYSIFVTFPKKTVSSTWERSQEDSIGSSLNRFPNNTACAAPTQMDDCFFGDVMQEGIATIILLPEISSPDDNELHATVQSNSSKNGEKNVTRQMDSINSILKCEICYKVFSTIERGLDHLMLQSLRNNIVLDSSWCLEFSSVSKKLILNSLPTLRNLNRDEEFGENMNSFSQTRGIKIGPSLHIMSQIRVSISGWNLKPENRIGKRDYITLVIMACQIVPEMFYGASTKYA
ncbi:hypothetical protein NPIL_438051 [Nephila pilipes]|uniref:Uncharacterized protein n=1 Tax=Nephila pilipes TaxID=299642 RepID=A0A8X6QUQ7_NEPPI|nr:hypothetical protein NPIL_438051 [Nephila pilipes]